MGFVFLFSTLQPVMQKHMFKAASFAAAYTYRGSKAAIISLGKQTLRVTLAFIRGKGEKLSYSAADSKTPVCLANVIWTLSLSSGAHVHLHITRDTFQT